MTTAPPVPPVRTIAETGSTQQDVLADVGDARTWPHLSGLRALRQVAGRGRGDRVWDTDRVEALTASLVLRPSTLAVPVPRERWSWLTSVTALALVRALRARGVAAGIKWPNDVVVPAATPVEGWGDWRKVAGVLAQVSADGDAVVVGIGVNLDGVPPVPWAGTVRAAGATAAGAELLEDLRAELAELVRDAGGWAAAVTGVCVTLGQQVLVQLPGGGTLRGEAIGLDDAGALLVADDAAPAAPARAVHAGDVVHCRTVPGADR